MFFVLVATVDGVSTVGLSYNLHTVHRPCRTLCAGRKAARMGLSAPPKAMLDSF
jgi:hypothetical protein